MQTITVKKEIFEKIWSEVIKKYYKEELGLEYNGGSIYPYSRDQVFGTPWATGCKYSNKRDLPTFIENIAHYKNSRSTFINRYNDLYRKNKPLIEAQESFISSLVITLGYRDIEDYCSSNNIDKNEMPSFTKTKNEIQKNLEDLNMEYDSIIKERDELNAMSQSTNSELEKVKKNNSLLKVTSIIGLFFIIIISIWFFTNNLKIKGNILRQIADSKSINGIIGAWNSYNRTGEARESNNGLIYNKMAWNFTKDKNDIISIERHWSSMEFNGWTEVIENQLHFFLDVFDSDNKEKKIGFRHFNCTKVGQDKTWEKTDTLICVCTSYTFDNSQLGKPLAIREILVRQRNISYDILKKGVASLPADSLPWLEKFLPKGQSYLYQNPTSAYNSITQKRPPLN